MPTISEFFGIMIRMHWRDHPRPHFHAFYSGDEAEYQVDPPERIDGEISERANRLVLEWARLHREDLLAVWDLLSRNLPAQKIQGLK